MRLENKIAIVTGAGRGIGRGIAQILAREGARMVVADVRYEDARKVAMEIRGLGRESLAVKVDVSKSGQVGKMVERTLKHFGRIDVLVKNVGIIRVSDVMDIS